MDQPRSYDGTRDSKAPYSFHTAVYPIETGPEVTELDQQRLASAVADALYVGLPELIRWNRHRPMAWGLYELVNNLDQVALAASQQDSRHFADYVDSLAHLLHAHQIPTHELVSALELAQDVLDARLAPHHRRVVAGNFEVALERLRRRVREENLMVKSSLL
jgi:hypothetical protein